MMKKVSAVIVTFNNDVVLKELIGDLLSQTCLPDEIIVIDNASTDDTFQIISDNFPRVGYISLSENEGSAGGYYEGIKAAVENKSDLIWTLDDDVRVDKNSLEELIKGFEDLNYAGNVWLVRSVGQSHPMHVPTEFEFFTWRGSLIRSDVVNRVGLPAKEYFIYGEDLEYSLRMKKKEYKCYWVPSSRCVEIRDGKTDDKFLGKSVKIYPHRFRLYYAFRNEFNIYLMYRCSIRFLRTFLYALKVMLYFLITKRLNGFGKIRAVMAGFIDDIRGKLGKNPRYLPEKKILC